MGPLFILQVLVVGFCSRSGHGATLDACMMVLLSEEFHTTCSTLGANHTRPCLVQSDEDVVALKRAKVIRRKLSLPRNKICAARADTGEADCVSVHLQCNPQENWQWTEWTGTSPNIARRFTITEGNTDKLCPYEERHFVPEVFSSCLDALNHGMVRSGVTTISPDGHTKLDVYCQQTLDGGGWTVIQRRSTGQLDFHKTWAEFKTGFGNLEGEHWLGNDYIHLLTKNNDQKIKIQLGSSDGQEAFADYSHFSLDDESLKYTIHISGYSGAAIPGDSMSYHNGRKFTTMDQDNDGRGGSNCAHDHEGAWWHRYCHTSNLNGDYGNIKLGDGLNWKTWKGYYHSMVYTAMMVKPR